MSILESIILGIVQGLTEFLPVSSSGHLVLLQNIFGISEPQLFFDTMLHLGTLTAVVVVMWKEIMSLFKRPLNKMLYLIIATIPAIVFGFLLSDFVEGTFSGVYLGYGFLLTAVILTVSEMLSKRTSKKTEVKMGSGIVMGFMQVVAMLPGVSRSGSTIAGGLFCGVDRSKAASFSFLMSIPVILGSVVLQGAKIMADTSLIVDWLPTIIGTVFAAASGYFAVRFMLALIKKKRLYGFAIYVAALGVFILLDKYVLGLVVWA